MSSNADRQPDATMDDHLLTCSGCGEDCSPEARFCASCGMLRGSSIPQLAAVGDASSQTETLSCNECTAVLQADWSFCLSCGAATPVGLAAPRPTAGTRPSSGAAAPAHRTTAPLALVPQPEREPLASVGSSPRTRPSSIVVAVVVGIVLVASAVTALLTLRGSDAAPTASTAAATRAEHRIDAIASPIIAAHGDLSRELNRLRGTTSVDARAAARRLDEASRTAQGQLRSLEAPGKAKEAREDARSLASASVAYAAGIDTVLANPAHPSSGSIVGEAEQVASSMDAIDPHAAGDAQIVSAAKRLSDWAPLAVAAKKRAAVARAARAEAASPKVVVVPGTTVSYGYDHGTAGSSVYGSDTKECEPLLYVRSSTTSCSFAANVQSEYWSSGQSGTIVASSPATGKDYVMQCGPVMGGTQCNGGVNASVTMRHGE